MFMIVKGSRWNNGIGRNINLMPFKVIGIIDKWVMIRRPGCTPTLAHVNSFGTGKEFVSVKK